jgi:dipeptidyl aminopeptidase/acylaminoacyl peptidase
VASRNANLNDAAHCRFQPTARTARAAAQRAAIRGHPLVFCAPPLPTLNRKLLLLAPALAVLLGACATAPAPTTPAEAVFPPNANLLVQGIPPIPQSLVDRVQRYTEFRGHSFVDWHPTRREMLVAHRKAGDNTAQLYRLAEPQGPLQQLTFEQEPVTRATYEPKAGQYLVYERSSGGNEAAQLYRLDLASGQSTLLTSPDERHATGPWLNAGGQLVYSSVPLDRTAAGGTRAQITTTYWLVDPLNPQGRRKLAELPGPGWFGAELSPDDRQMAVTRYLSANESQVWLVNLADGSRRQVLPAPGDTTKAAHFPGKFLPDGSGLYFASNRAGEFRELMKLDFASGAVQRITAHIPWDVSGATRSADGQLVALQANVEGRDELHFIDTRTQQPVAVPAGLPVGVLGSTEFHPQRAELAVSVNSAQGPSQLYTLDLAQGRWVAWTTAQAAPGIDTREFSSQQTVRWTSFDGRSISGLMTRPPASFKGKRPVVIDIHGGPEGQATAGFRGRNAALTQALGLVVIEPNVRGSSGFGKTFLTLDDGYQREDSVKDIGALLDWIATQPDLDASRVLVMGGSYGGYMSLAVAVHYSDRIAGAVDVVGISHFVTFLNNTESYRRDLRRAEYGDERDPAMRAFLDRISPLTNASQIKKPLFVVQGKNDPRVPYTEAEQIVAKVRANGTPVWYLRAENEGHGFARKENADFYLYAVVKFIETVLLK